MDLNDDEIKMILKNNDDILELKNTLNMFDIDEIIEKYPDKSWNWEWIIENTILNVEKYIPLEIIKKYSDELNGDFLIYNKNLTEEFIFENLNKNWNMDYLIENNKINNFNYIPLYEYITIDTLIKYLDRPWNWDYFIQKNRYKHLIFEHFIPMKLIEKYKDKWDYYKLSQNTNLTEEFILRYPNKNWNISWFIDHFKLDFDNLIKLNITQDIINKYPNKSWNWDWLYLNTNIHIEEYIPLKIIKKYNKWNYLYLSKNPNLTEEIILKYPNQNWNIPYLIENNKITDFDSLSEFKYLNQDIIDKYPNKSWNWDWLYLNTNIYIEKHIPLYMIKKYNKWDYYYLSKNPSLTEEIILKYPNQNWNIPYLIENNKITDFDSLSEFKYLNQDIIDKYPNKSWKSNS